MPVFLIYHFFRQIKVYVSVLNSEMFYFYLEMQQNAISARGSPGYAGGAYRGESMNPNCEILRMPNDITLYRRIGKR